MYGAPLTPPSESLFALLENAAAEHGQALFAGFADESDPEQRNLSFARAHDEALRIAASLEREGVTPGQRVLLMLPTSAR